MLTSLRKIPITIWGLAFGYFAFYVPYGALTKALSRGLVPGVEGPISGFEMLPTVVIGTFFALVIILSIMGWWKYASHHKVLGINIPFVSNRWTLFSGLGTAFIIMTTTLAYSFTGISIVFAALLMRGGVLLLAPVVDLVFGRKVHWYSWIALGLSLLALLLIFAEKGGYQLTIVAGLNIAFYLSGYIFRLQYMTHIAKSKDRETNYRFFVEEMLVAMAAIVLIPAILALIGYGNIMQDLQTGFVTFLATPIALPALGIGALYACLYIFGTRIYLNKRENTFCIPINRCASLLAGVVASLLLGVIIGESFVSSAQLLSASILVLAICFLSFPVFQQYFGWGNQDSIAAAPKAVYLFVCPGNTGRSPMAQAICESQLTAQLHQRGIDIDKAGIQVVSAGIMPKEGTPLSQDAHDALVELGVKPPIHFSQQLTTQQIRTANKIFCMSEAHRTEIIRRYPPAILKTFCLDPASDVPNPHGKGVAAYIACGKRMQELVSKAMEAKLIQV